MERLKLQDGQRELLTSSDGKQVIATIAEFIEATEPDYNRTVKATKRSEAMATLGVDVNNADQLVKDSRYRVALDSEDATKAVYFILPVRGN